ncbi:MAG: hypothetical protein ACN6I5_06785 [Hyphomicrobiales bacterium]
MNHTIEANRGVIILFLLGLCSAILLSVISAIAGSFLFDYLLPQELTWLGHLVLFVAFAVLLAMVVRAIGRRADKILGAEVRATDANSHPAVPFVVMGYSPLSKPIFDEMLDEIGAAGLGFEGVARNVADYDALRAEKGDKPIIGNAWQQNIRALWHHRDALEAVFVLDPDRDQFDKFSTYVTEAFSTIGRTVRIIRIAEAHAPGRPFALHDGSGAVMRRSYVNYDYVYGGLSRALEMVRQDEGCRARTEAERSANPALGHFEEACDRLTVIDATAGQKSFSIAAAVLTLNRPLRFSYVTTSGIEIGDDGTEHQVGGELRFYDTNLRLAGAAVG